MLKPLVPLLLFSILAVASGPLESADWRAFRGTNGDGKSEESGFPVEWSPEKNIKWRTPLPVPGNSSPIVVQGRVFLTCAEDQGRQRSLLCFDRENGNELWRRTVEYPEVEQTHKTNPYCSATPVSDGERVVVWHRSAGMHCYDLDGRELWSRDLGRFSHIWEGGSSPILHGESVIQLSGPGERTFVIALDKHTGKTLWQTPDEPGGSESSQGRYIGTWSTPVVIHVNDQSQVLVPMHFRVIALDPSSGSELWSIDGISGKGGDVVYTSPMVDDNLAVVMAGYHGPAFGFVPGGTGDMTEKNRLWHTGETQNPQRIGSGVVLDGHLFMANADDAGSIECVDVQSGNRRWHVRRTSGGPHWGSMVHAAGMLYVTGQRGITQVFRADPNQYEVVAENDLGEQSNSTPALSEGEIFLRTWEALYCIGS